MRGFFSVSVYSSPHGVLFLSVLSGAHLCIPLFITNDLFSTADFNVRHFEKPEIKLVVNIAERRKNHKSFSGKRQCSFLLLKELQKLQ